MRRVENIIDALWGTRVSVKFPAIIHSCRATRIKFRFKGTTDLLSFAGCQGGQQFLVGQHLCVVLRVHCLNANVVGASVPMLLNTLA